MSRLGYLQKAVMCVQGAFSVQAEAYASAFWGLSSSEVQAGKPASAC